MNDERILSEEDLVKPERPEDLDENKLYESIRKDYLESHKTPGDPLLSFDLIQESGTITPTAQCTPLVFLTSSYLFLLIIILNRFDTESEFCCCCC